MSATPAVGPTVRSVGRLATPEVAQVLAVAHAAGETDGSFPLSEHVVLQIRHGAGAPVHLLVHRAGALAGYANVDVTDPADAAVGELVVHPTHRRHGLGRALILAALAAADETRGRRSPSPSRLPGGGGLRLWAHGDHPAAAALAGQLGFRRARALWQMRRPLSAPLPEIAVPAGITLRGFRPGADDDAWVRLNARAFAEHPEQGRWTVADLRVRMAEPWFDPAGFLLAQDAATGDLLGFHWTKVHADGAGGPQHEPIGEVYVLGVDPAAHGRGLGGALTVAGLRRLQDHGLAQAMLYVDEDNAAAVALYGRLDFTRWSTDVSYHHAG